MTLCIELLSSPYKSNQIKSLDWCVKETNVYTLYRNIFLVIALVSNYYTTLFFVVLTMNKAWENAQIEHGTPRLALASITFVVKAGHIISLYQI